MPTCQAYFDGADDTFCNSQISGQNLEGKKLAGYGTVQLRTKAYEAWNQSGTCHYIAYNPSGGYQNMRLQFNTTTDGQNCHLTQIIT
jgi:hypothetical protein